MLDKINGAILSPLAGYTDIAFREICSECNAFMTTTEMVSAKALYFKDEKSQELLEISKKENKVAIQLFGDDPDIIGEVIKNQLNDLNFYMIDINMGCPVPKIVKNNSGSALLDQPELAYEIMKSAVKASTKPVSIKIRKSIRGFDSIKVAQLAEKAGISLITVHGRSREQYYSGNSDWDYIRKIKDEVNIPVIGNGDIISYEDALEKIEFSKVDGVSIGRGAIGNPFIFKEIFNKFNNIEYIPPTYEEKINMAIYNLKLCCEYKSENIGIKRMRKHLGDYLKGMKNSKEIKDKINKINEFDEVVKILEDYKNDLLINSID